MTTTFSITMFNNCHAYYLMFNNIYIQLMLKRYLFPPNIICGSLRTFKKYRSTMVSADRQYKI